MNSLFLSIAMYYVKIMYMSLLSPVIHVCMFEVVAHLCQNKGTALLALTFSYFASPSFCVLNCFLL